MMREANLNVVLRLPTYSFPPWRHRNHPDFFFSSGRRHTISTRDWSSDVCSSDLFREVKLRRDPKCPVCGEHPSIRDLAKEIGRASGRERVESSVDAESSKEEL